MTIHNNSTATSILSNLLTPYTSQEDNYNINIPEKTLLTLFKYKNNKKLLTKIKLIAEELNLTNKLYIINNIHVWGADGNGYTFSIKVK
jgi:hypothetical protein